MFKHTEWTVNVAMMSKLPRCRSKKTKAYLKHCRHHVVRVNGALLGHNDSKRTYSSFNWKWKLGGILKSIL